MGKRNIIQTLCMMLCIGAIIFMWGMDLIRLSHWMVPNEIRESANAAIVELFAKGINPYKQLATEDGAPLVFYMYPLLNNVIAAIIVKVTGASGTLVLLLLNYFWSILVGILLYKIVKHNTHNTYWALLAMLLSHYCGWRQTNVSQFPDMLGVLFIVLVTYICVIEKTVSKKKVILLSVITVLCFFTKQYTVIVAFPIIIYLWVKQNKWKCLTYISISAILGLLAIICIYTVMPLYLVETMLLVKNSADNDIWWAIIQFIKMGKIFFGLFLVMLIGGLYLLWKRRFEINYVVILMICVFVLLWYFGQNTGANLSYYLQLWFPSIIIVAMSAFSWLSNLYSAYWIKDSILIIGLICAIMPYYWLHTPWLSFEQKENYERLYELADESNEFLATSQLGGYALERGIYFYDYGQNQYILRQETMEYWETIENSELICKLFPQVLELRNLHEDYREEILRKIEKKEYDRLFLVDNFGFARDWVEFEELKVENYEVTESINIETGTWKWDIKIWEPN